MATIDNKEKYGIILWGTKRGVQTFSKSNVQAEGRILLEDMRAYFNFDRNNPHASLIGYECVGNSCHAYTLYRPVLDWLSRSGFFALTLLVDNSRQAPLDKMYDLLNRLTNMYMEKYFNKRERIIDEYAREDIELFNAVLNETSYQLKPAVAQPLPESTKGYWICENADELKTKLHWLHPSLHPKIASFFLLTKNDGTFVGDLKPLELTAPKAKVKLSVQLKAANAAAREDLSFKVQFKNEGKTTQYTAKQGSFEIEQIEKEERLTISLLPNPHYKAETFGINVENCLDNGVYKKEIQLTKTVWLDVYFPDLERDQSKATIRIVVNNNPQEKVLHNGKCRVEGLSINDHVVVFF